MREVIRRILKAFLKTITKKLSNIKSLRIAMKNYQDTPVPSNCPICYNTIFGKPIMRFGILDWEEMRQRWQCQECLSIFNWEPADRIVSKIETHFPRGILGNVDVEAINNGRGNNTIDPKLPDEFDPPGYKHERNFEN